MLKTVFTASMFLFATTALAQNGTASNPGTPSGLSDGQIAKVLMTINEGEIDAAKIAKRKVKNKELKEFAEIMINDHKDNEKETTAVAKAANAPMKDSDLSRTLKKEAKEANAELKKSGKSLDKNYSREQITMHEKALETIKGNLIPSAKDPAMKTHLEKTAQAVQTHLDHIKKIDTTVQ